MDRMDPEFARALQSHVEGHTSEELDGVLLFPSLAYLYSAVVSIADHFGWDLWFCGQNDMRARVTTHCDFVMPRRRRRYDALAFIYLAWLLSPGHPRRTKADLLVDAASLHIKVLGEQLPLPASEASQPSQVQLTLAPLMPPAPTSGTACVMQPRLILTVH